MATYARSQITAPESQVASYLLTNRVVRKTWLFGRDKSSGKDYDYRKKWVEDRINDVIDKAFFMDLHTYVIMSNHFHVVVTTRPDLCNQATDEEIVQRWWNLFPRKVNGVHPPSPPENLKRDRLNDLPWIKERRRKLCSISTFMGEVAVHISRRVNEEEDCTGHLWQDRFDSQILLDVDAVMSANLYVDLNPIRADMAANIREIRNGSISKRLQVLEDQISSVNPIPFLSIANSKFEVSRDQRILITFSLQKYIQVLDFLSTTDPQLVSTERVESIPVFNIKACRFAIGSSESVDLFALNRKRRRENLRRKFRESE